MIPDDVSYDRLVHLLYDSLEDSQGWTKALIALADYIKADHVILDLQPQKPDLITARVDPEHLQAFVSHPEYSLFRSIAKSLQPGWAVLDEEVFDRKLRLHSDFFADVISPMGGHHAMLASPRNIGLNNQTVLVAFRSKKNSAFSTEELAKLQRVLPHVKNVLRLHERFAQCNTELQWKEETLEAMPFGLFILDALGCVVYFNLAAKALIQSQGALLIAKNGRLVTAFSESTSLLRKAISDAQNGEPGAPVRVQSESTYSDLWLRVIPVFPDGYVAGRCTQSKVIVLCDSTNGRELTYDKFSAFFKFTRREADLAILLAKGEKLDLAAQHLGVSLETARSHLKSLFNKTDTHRQVELVRLLLSFQHLF